MKSNSSTKKEADNILQSLSKNTMVRQMGRRFVKEIIAIIAAALGFKSTRRK